ncbi:aspartyl-phosphate phosphatase Spo0E family protein [Clostridium beijerinckii]|uniref:aspartyl-phosphate phosphatase Spo0E family protein n=1 Tax=Clostridium beijerinckii TaxID=1520 RepID=UPI0009B91DAA|nr:aspartyl-phosphate phosphatase Spo0E family protein [Clostridium beijerinckii]
MDKKKEIEELRDKLNKTITEKMDYNKILKLSQELDIYIVEVMKADSESMGKE